MAITNIDEWVNDFNDVGLPALRQKDNDLSDQITVQDIEIAAARDVAEISRLVSEEVSTRLYDLDLAIRAYVADQVNSARGSIQSNYTTALSGVSSSLEALLDAKIGDQISVRDQAVIDALAQMSTLSSEVTGKHEAVLSAVDSLASEVVPAIDLELTNLQNAVDSVGTAFDDFNLNFTYPRLVDGLVALAQDSDLQLQTAKTELQGNIDGVSSLLTNDYMTAQTTTDAIAASQTYLEAKFDNEIGGATLASINMTNRALANVNNSIVWSQMLLSSEVQTETGAIRATIEQDYVTNTSMDAAIASATTSITTAYQNYASTNINNAITALSSPTGAITEARNYAASLTDGAMAEIESVGTTVATVAGNQAASYVMRLKAGSSEASLEMVAADDVNGTASSLRVSADDILFQGTVHAGLMDVNSVLARNIVIDDMLAMSAETSAFVMGKSDAYDVDDGIYFGRTPASEGVGFAFAVSRTADSGLREELSATKSEGLLAKNMKFFRSLYQASNTRNVYSTTTINLDKNTVRLISAVCVGGGGGGANGNQNSDGGYNGGATTVELRDGTTVIASITGSGGAGAPGGGWSGSTDTGEQGRSSPFGTGGAGGYVGDDTTNPRSYNRGQNASGYGAGGGGGSGNGSSNKAGAGGQAGGTATVAAWDISGLANPNVRITIGSAGAGRSSGTESRGGNGSPGFARIYEQASADIKANVLPISPSAEGSMNAAGPYPDLGAGLWEIYTTDGSPVYLGWVGGTGAGTTRIHETSYATFVSSQTPWCSSGGATKNVEYKFFYLGHD